MPETRKMNVVTSYPWKPPGGRICPQTWDMVPNKKHPKPNFHFEGRANFSDPKIERIAKSTARAEKMTFKDYDRSAIIIDHGKI